MNQEQRQFRGNPVALKRLRLQFGLTIEKFCGKAHLDKGTAQKLFRGGPVTLQTIAEAAKVFGVTNHLELLHPDELFSVGVDPDASAVAHQVHEWIVETHLTGWERTANGLQYQVARLKHRLLKDRFARGKCYELRHLPVAERHRLDEHLRRHAEVCERIGKHPHIAENLDATFVEHGGLWWVIDRWEDGETLEVRFKRGALDSGELKTVMLGVAEGLAALHKGRIVRRNLAPRFITLRAKHLSPLLTDFELAKLLEGDRTVRPEGEWPDDPYLAIEVNGETPIDERADVYSWGRIFVEAATGTLPERGREAVTLNPAALPPDLTTLVEQCVAKRPSKRPGDMTQILSALKRWRT